jgi:hypothetical protein
MENIYKWLFGESKWQQKKKLKRLLLITVVLAVIALILLTDGLESSMFVMTIILLVWGWGFVRATASKVGGIIDIFGGDVAIFVLSIILWIFLGVFGGAASFILGIVRFIELKRE